MNGLIYKCSYGFITHIWSVAVQRLLLLSAGLCFMIRSVFDGGLRLQRWSRDREVRVFNLECVWVCVSGGLLHRWSSRTEVHSDQFDESVWRSRCDWTPVIKLRSNKSLQIRLNDCVIDQLCLVSKALDEHVYWCTSERESANLQRLWSSTARRGNINSSHDDCFCGSSCISRKYSEGCCVCDWSLRQMTSTIVHKSYMITMILCCFWGFIMKHATILQNFSM